MQNDRLRPSPAIKGPPGPRRSLAAQVAIVCWGSLFIALLVTAIVPSLRHRMLTRVWALQGWSPDSRVRSYLRDGGGQAVGALLPYLKPEGGQVRDIFLEMGGTALDRFWQELADHEPSREFFIGLIAKNTSPDVRGSVEARLHDANPVVRRAAIEISLVHFNHVDRAWTTDSDLVVRAMALPYFLEPRILDSAIHAGGEMAKEVLHLALRTADQREERMMHLRRHELMPGASHDDPLWSARFRELKRQVLVSESRSATLDECLTRNIDFLLRSSEPLPHQLYTWLEFHGPQERFLPLLREALLLKDPDHRRCAALCLGAWKDEPSAKTLWTMTQEDADEVVRISAWEALKMMAPSSLLPDLRLFLQNQKVDPVERLDAIELMGQVGTLDDIPLLQSIVQGYEYDCATVARGACHTITERAHSGR